MWPDPQFQHVTAYLGRQICAFQAHSISRTSIFKLGVPVPKTRFQQSIFLHAARYQCCEQLLDVFEVQIRHSPTPPCAQRFRMGSGQQCRLECRMYLGEGVMGGGAGVNVDIHIQHLLQMLHRGGRHRGGSLVSLTAQTGRSAHSCSGRPVCRYSVPGCHGAGCFPSNGFMIT